MQVNVNSSIDHHTLLLALTEITIRNERFDPNIWSISDGEALIRAGCMMIREINDASPARKHQLSEVAKGSWAMAALSCVSTQHTPPGDVKPTNIDTQTSSC